MATTRPIGRLLHQTFGISAPRMAIRTQLSWRWKLPALAGLLSFIVGMWWLGFDFGQLLSGFNRSAVAQTQARLESELAASKDETSRLRARTTELESGLKVSQGAQAALSQQALELQGENTQLKEELAFLQKFFGDTGKLGTVSIERLAAEREGDDAWHFSFLVVRGGSPRDDFAGHVSLHASLIANGQTLLLALPEDQPATAAALKLKFKYYQRVEGTLRVPPGAQLKSLQARIIEPTQGAPKATRNLMLP